MIGSILCLVGWEYPEEVILQMGELFEGVAELLAQDFEFFTQLPSQVFEFFAIDRLVRHCGFSCTLAFLVAPKRGSDLFFIPGGGSDPYP